jgi:hypothetical protein
MNMPRTLQERLQGAEAEPFLFTDEGDAILGEVEEVSEREGDYGTYTVVTLITADGDVHSVAGFGQVLARKLEGANLVPGDKLGVKFLGEKRSKAGKDYKDYQVVVERASQTKPSITDDFDDDVDLDA